MNQSMFLYFIYLVKKEIRDTGKFLSLHCRFIK